MKEIPLTKSQVALVDDEDYERISAHKWYAQLNRCTNSYYAARKSPPDVNGKRHTILMHREVMSARPGEDVDHIDHNTVDQRKTNLRFCSRSQNGANIRMRSSNTSGYKGVSWYKQGGKWRADMSVNGKKKYLGHYATAPEAAIAYDKAAIELHGQNALTNAMLGLIPSPVDSPCAAIQNMG